MLHQPRRVRLPAVALPRGAPADDLARRMFDHDLNQHYFQKVARWCYQPALPIWRRLLDEGLTLALGVPLSTVKQFETWAPDLLEEMQGLMAHPRAELVAVEPSHAMTMLIDLPTFAAQMELARSGAAKAFGVEPVVADTTEMLMSADIYRALQAAGYQGTFVDGRGWVMQWRESTHCYNYDGGSLKILPRNFPLSDDVGYRFSNRSWDRWPLMADTYARWIREAPGEFVLLAWDFETFGEHHNRDTGIFEFLEALPQALARHGVTCITPSEAMQAPNREVHDLPLSPFPTTWAGESGGLEFFLGNHAQQAIYRLMSVAYGAARMTGDPELVEIAHWLMQSDNLHWLQWVGRVGSEADVSAYFTPQEWMWMGTDRLLWEHQRVYVNFLDAIA